MLPSCSKSSFGLKSTPPVLQVIVAPSAERTSRPKIIFVAPRGSLRKLTRRVWFLTCIIKAGSVTAAVMPPAPVIRTLAAPATGSIPRSFANSRLMQLTSAPVSINASTLIILRPSLLHALGNTIWTISIILSLCPIRLSEFKGTPEMFGTAVLTLTVEHLVVNKSNPLSLNAT